MNYLKIFLFLFLFLFEKSYADNLGFIIHQSFSENPCWVLTKIEVDEFYSKASCSSSAQNLNKNGLSVKDVFQSIVFDLAKNRKNEQARCHKKLFEMLLDKKKYKAIHDYWVKITSTYLAQYVYSKKLASDLVDERKIEHFQSNKIKKSKDNRSYPELVKDYNEAFQSIPFSSNSKVEEQLNSLVKDTFGTDPSKYPSDEDAIKGTLLRKLDWASEEVFAKILLDFDESYLLYPNKAVHLNTSEKTKLVKEGHVLAVLEDLYPDKASLKEKYMNCIKGDYGEWRENFDFMKDLGFSLVGGGVLTNAKLLRNVSLLNFFRASFQFGFGSMSAYYLKGLPETAVRSCFAKYPESETQALPKDCGGKLYEYSVEKSLEVQSCIADLVAVFI